MRSSSNTSGVIFFYRTISRDYLDNLLTIYIFFYSFFCYGIYQVLPVNGGLFYLIDNIKRKRPNTNLLNNKTIVLLNVAEYRVNLADSAYGLVGYVSDDIPRDLAG